MESVVRETPPSWESEAMSAGYDTSLIFLPFTKMGIGVASLPRRWGQFKDDHASHIWVGGKAGKAPRRLTVFVSGSDPSRWPCFSSGMKPRVPERCSACVLLFSPAVKIQENVGVEPLSGFLAASQSVFSHLGGRGTADFLFMVVSATLSQPPCPVPAEPGSKFKAEMALLSNSGTLPSLLPCKG